MLEQCTNILQNGKKNNTKRIYDESKIFAGYFMMSANLIYYNLENGINLLKVSDRCHRSSTKERSTNFLVPSKDISVSYLLNAINLNH